MKREESLMDICIVNIGFGLGGVERVAIELANSLYKSNNKVTLIDFSGENTFFYDVDKGIKKTSIIKKRKLKRKIIKRTLYFKYKLDRKTLHIIDLYKEQAKDLVEYLKYSNHEIVILCQDSLTALVPTIKKEVPGIKVVAWQHNNYDVYVKNYCKEFVNDYLLGVKEADLVVCLTKSDLEKFKKINYNACYIYNPLTLSHPKLSNLENKNIIFVGRLNMEQKGLEYLIDIGKKLNEDWRILIAGEGKDKEKFSNLILNNNLENQIILRGSLKDKELADFYSSGSIFISTSRWEGFGLVITEAMASGLPVVSFNNLGPKEILDEGTYGVLIEKFDIEEFIVQLNLLMLYKEKREYFQAKSIERSEFFSPQVILKQWVTRLSSL